MPINVGMSHNAYLGQMLEKGEGFAVGIFPEGLVLLLVNFTDMYPYFSSHTVHNREIAIGYL